jgi:flagellar basal body-associated protein FliL
MLGREDFAMMSSALNRQKGAAKMMIIAVVAALVLAGGAVGVTLFLTGGAKPEKGAKKKGGAKPEAAASADAAHGEGTAEGEGEHGAEDEHAEEEGGEEESGGDALPYQYYKLDPPMIINIGDHNNRAYLLQMQIEVRFNNPDVGAALNVNAAMIRNNIIIKLLELKPEALKTTASRIAVQETVKGIINDVLKKVKVKGKIDNVYFNSFVVQ